MGGRWVKQNEIARVSRVLVQGVWDKVAAWHGLGYMDDTKKQRPAWCARAGALTKMSAARPGEEEEAAAAALVLLGTSLASKNGFLDMLVVEEAAGGGRKCGELAEVVEGEGEAARLRKGLLEAKLKGKVVPKDGLGVCDDEDDEDEVVAAAVVEERWCRSGGFVRIETGDRRGCETGGLPRVVPASAICPANPA